MTDYHPKADELIVPVYIPDNNGEPVLQIGEGSLENDTLTIKFNDSIAALMLERKLARGEIMGFSVINVQEQLDAFAESSTEG